VIALLLVLAAILLPATVDGNHKRSTVVQCMSNQKQIAIGLIMWNADNASRFPWQVSTTNGGASEAANRGYAAANFLCLSTYMRNPDIYVCPTDTNRFRAADFSQLRNQNLSYFVAFAAPTNASDGILTGDRHLANNGKPLSPGLFCYSHSVNMDWTRELHGKMQYSTWGVLSFYDGHAQAVRSQNLNSTFRDERLDTNYLAIP